MPDIMYAIIKSGGRQYMVAPDKIIRVDLLEAAIGQEVELDVLLVGDGGAVKAGHPLLAGASVKAKVLNHDRAKKILVFKKKRRQGYHKAKGHRQDFTTLQVVSITG
jgi:large subunit ribosomal protein L21